jgi:hypothetical protein
MKDPKPETPALSRAGKKLAEASLTAAKFRPTIDGKRMVRQYEVHGMEVTEWIDPGNATQTKSGR